MAHQTDPVLVYYDTQPGRELHALQQAAFNKQAKHEVQISDQTSDSIILPLAKLSAHAAEVVA